jgi:hypothetical protein
VLSQQHHLSVGRPQASILMATFYTLRRSLSRCAEEKVLGNSRIPIADLVSACLFHRRVVDQSRRMRSIAALGTSSSKTDGVVGPKLKLVPPTVVIYNSPLKVARMGLAEACVADLRFPLKSTSCVLAPARAQMLDLRLRGKPLTVAGLGKDLTNRARYRRRKVPLQRRGKLQRRRRRGPG